jgi:hypothetical protein
MTRAPLFAAVIAAVKPRAGSDDDDVGVVGEGGAVFPDQFWCEYVIGHGWSPQMCSTRDRTGRVQAQMDCWPGKRDRD